MVFDAFTYILLYTFLVVLKARSELWNKALKTGIRDVVLIQLHS